MQTNSDFFEPCGRYPDDEYNCLSFLETHADPLERSELAADLAEYDGPNRGEAEAKLLYLARDPDDLVRTEAYDSLAAFPSDKTERFLKEAILEERDELARSYAIMSWTDIVEMRTSNVMTLVQTRSFTENLLKTEKSDFCRICLWRAKYLFGDKEAAERLIAFLWHKDYHIRCFAVDFLQEILNEQNTIMITHEVKRLLKSESVVCVSERARRLLQGANDMPV